MAPSADPAYVLTLDVGTSSVRALLFDRRARRVEGAEARRPYAMRTTPDGGVDGDPLAILRLVEECIDEMLASKKLEAGLVGVACCTFWHSLMGVGADGAPLTPLYTWGDTRSEAEWRELRGRLDERAYHARTGGFFHPCYHPAKLLWLSRRQPDVFRRASRWISFGEFLYDRLFGRTLATVSMASGSGLLDVTACAYDLPILREVGVRPDQLSPLGDVKDFFSGLREPYASRWPLLKDAKWTPPVGDGACNNLGSGCTGPDRVGLMIGTSGAIRVTHPDAAVRIPWSIFCYRADRRRALLGGGLSEGGNLVEWVRSTFRVGAPEAVEQELAAMEPDAHGLTFLPFLAGERAPGYAADARASISGLRLSTRPVEVLRAGMEAVALRFALIHRLLEESSPAAREIVASGGALLKSPAWTQMMADALGRPIVASAEPEASCRGAALLTLEAHGAIRRLEEIPAAFGRSFQPDPARRAAYAAALERQRRAYGLLVAP